MMTDNNNDDDRRSENTSTNDEAYRKPALEPYGRIVPSLGDTSFPTPADDPDPGF